MLQAGVRERDDVAVEKTEERTGPGIEMAQVSVEASGEDGVYDMRAVVDCKKCTTNELMMKE